MAKRCPKCKIKKDRSKWAKGGYRNITYCRKCTKEVNALKRDKAHKKIMKATNNGKAWWLLQSINAERHFRKSED